MSDTKKAADAAANASLQEEMDAVMRKYDRESATRVWTGKPKIVISVVMALFSIYCIWSTLFSTAALEIRLTAFLGLIVIMGYLTYPASKKHVHPNRLPWYDIVIMVIGAAAFFYYCFNYSVLIKTLTSAAKMTPFLIAVGVAGILVLAELCRRCVGLPILVVVGALLVYTFVSMLNAGQTFQQVLGRVIYTLFFGTSGVLSTPVQVCAKFIAVFIIFGGFLERTGIASFFIDAANAIAGWTSGGPAKVAVISSALCGMVSGSSVGNTVTTGSVTIPMMKRTGYKPEFAGAVEAAASTGGQIMPPIMGAAAFILAEMTGIGYGTVCVAAAIPAFLYYISVFIMVDVEALKNDLLGMDEKDIPLLIPVLKRSAKLIIPVVVLIVTLVVFNITPMRCALYAMAAVVLCALFDKNDRFSFKHLKNAFCQAAIGSAQIVAACAASGIVIAMLSLTGLGLKFSNFILTLGGSNLVLCLVFSMLVSIILGMGLPTTAAYIITATTIAPSLLKLGLPPLCAHLFLFYFASLSCITPPVAIASYAGAALADANPSKVGWEAVRLGIVAFLIPYSFCLTPGVIMLDFSSFATGITGVLSALLTLLAALPIAWLMQGYTYRRVGILWRLLFAVCAVMLIIPDLIIEIPAAVIVLGIYYLHKRDYVKGRSIPA